MSQRRNFLIGGLGILLLTPWPAFAQSRRKWNEGARTAYASFMLQFLEDYTSEIDCADLALTGLIDFSVREGLPVRLFDYEGPNQSRRWFEYFPGIDFNSNAEYFKKTVLYNLGAVNLLDRNTVNIPIGRMRPGDLIVNESPGAVGYTGHVRIFVSSVFDSIENDWMMHWIQGSGSNGEGSIPEHRSNYSRQIFPEGDLKMRRWNFDLFTWPT